MSGRLNPFADNPERAWKQCGVAPIRAREEEKTGKPFMDIDVVGLRSDGMIFTVTTSIDAIAIKDVNPIELVMGMHQQLMLAFGKLEGFRNCDCLPGVTCRTHDGSTIISPTEPITRSIS